MHAGIFITSCVLTVGTLAVLGECTSDWRKADKWNDQTTVIKKRGIDTNVKNGCRFLFFLSGRSEEDNMDDFIKMSDFTTENLMMEREGVFNEEKTKRFELTFICSGMETMETEMSILVIGLNPNSRDFWPWIPQHFWRWTTSCRWDFQPSRSATCLPIFSASWECLQSRTMTRTWSISDRFWSGTLTGFYSAMEIPASTTSGCRRKEPVDGAAQTVERPCGGRHGQRTGIRRPQNTMTKRHGFFNLRRKIWLTKDF